MNLAVIGATGRTGTEVVRTALQRGHHVRALVRDPGQLTEEFGDRVRVVVGDATDPAVLRELLSGSDAVVSALGPTGREAHLHTRTAQSLISIMTTDGPRRFVGVSGAGIDVPGDRKATKDKVISKLIQTVGGNVVKDKPAEYAAWAASDLDWTLVRPPRLVDGPATGDLEHDAHRSTRSTKITRQDLARFLLDEAEQSRYLNRAPFVANR